MREKNNKHKQERKQQKQQTQQMQQRIKELDKHQRQISETFLNLKVCCIICMDSPRSHIVVPCRHVCTCQRCSNELLEREDDDRCPICKNDIQQAINCTIHEKTIRKEK